MKWSGLNNEDKAFFIILFISSLTLLGIFFNAEATFDAGDGLMHYYISRYSWQHLELFLHHWGKPVFTLLSSPFAQFGIKGMYFFQVLCFASTSFFAYKISQKLGLKFGWSLPVFIGFVPVYFQVLNTGLTEILFGCAAMAVIWLVFERRWMLAATVASFIPFIRPESNVVLPLLFICLVWNQQWKSIPFLFGGYVLYSIAGYFYYHDILWISHQNYSLMGELYEGVKGPFFFYFTFHREIFGLIYFLLFCFGIPALAIRLWSARKQPQPFLVEELFLIYGIAFGCLFLHVILYWWPGIFTNLGMFRYMATVIPAGSLVVLRGLNLFLETTIQDRRKVLIAALILFSSAITPFQQYAFPFKLGVEERVLTEAAKWMKDHADSEDPIHYLHPYMPLVLNFDPYSNVHYKQTYGLDSIQPSKDLADKAWLLWDAHYSAVEGKLPLEILLKDPQLALVKKFIPEYSFPVIGGRNFEIYLFQKGQRKGTDSTTLLGQDYIDFENKETVLHPDQLSDKQAASGKWSAFVHEGQEFGPEIRRSISTLKQTGSLGALQVSGMIYPETITGIYNVVAEIRTPGDSLLFWEAHPILDQKDVLGQWKTFKTSYFFPQQKIKPENSIKLYIWNQGKGRFYTDDLRIEYQSSGLTVVVP